MVIDRCHSFFVDLDDTDMDDEDEEDEEEEEPEPAPKKGGKKKWRLFL